LLALAKGIYNLHQVYRPLIVVAAQLLVSVAAAQSPAVGKCPVLPLDNIWNTPIDQLPLAANSAAYINTIGAAKTVHADFGAGLYAGGPIGIPFLTVSGAQTRYPASFEYADESDAGPYAVPLNAPIEGGSQSGGDRHAIAVDTDNCVLYELYSAYPQSASWQAGSGAIYNLLSNALRPATWTSADAAGLPIFPGLMRYDEIAAGEIRHAVRFTAAQTQRAFLWPARHQASSLTDPKYPPMGLRVRLRADYDISGFSATNQIILRALKKYGMLLADNGSSWFISGAPDSRWDNDDLHKLGVITGSAFEAVDSSSLMTDANSGQARQGKGQPVWSLSVSHSGSFVQGQNGAAYTIGLSNSGGAPSSGATTISENLPAGLTLVTMSGANWNCSANTCTRADALNAGMSYAPITVIVNVLVSAAGSVVNQVSASGGGAALATANDVTTILASQPPVVSSLNPVTGVGATASLTARFSDSAGWQALSVVNVLINDVLDGRNACYLAYSVATNTLYLVPDNGVGLLPPVTLNGAGSTSNQQCSVSGAGSSASGSGNMLSLTLGVTFNDNFGGHRVIYAAARDAAQNGSGWQIVGVHASSLSPSSFPAPIGVTPSSGSGASQTITLTYQDETDATNLQTVWALINTAIDGRAACYVAYYRPANRLYLYPDNGDGTQAGNIVLTGNNTISNSQCTVSALGASVQAAGNTLTLSLPISFKSSFAGFKGAWLAAQTTGGAQTSAWQAMGAWTLPAN
jgi:uncharacterized repeat protein (TIGR01451 family)